MLVRIVQMRFREEKIEEFLENFDSVKEKIRSFRGCRLLELYRDRNDPTRFFTYSYWDSEDDLDAYRSSPMFEEVWNRTKTMFSERAQAWSTEKLVSLK